MIESFFDVDFSIYKFPIIAIFERPKDCPDACIARLFDVNVPLPLHIVRDTVDELRALIPQDHFIRVNRYPSDHFTVVETWI